MSGGPACRSGAHRMFWVVVQRGYNMSAFNGYHKTPSAYSLVRCTFCQAAWRTNAKYVGELADAEGAS